MRTAGQLRDCTRLFQLTVRIVIKPDMPGNGASTRRATGSSVVKMFVHRKKELNKNNFVCYKEIMTRPGKSHGAKSRWQSAARWAQMGNLATAADHDATGQIRAEKSRSRLVYVSQIRASQECLNHGQET